MGEGGNVRILLLFGEYYYIINILKNVTVLHFLHVSDMTYLTEQKKDCLEDALQSYVEPELLCVGTRKIFDSPLCCFYTNIILVSL